MEQTQCVLVCVFVTVESMTTLKPSEADITLMIYEVFQSWNYLLYKTLVKLFPTELHFMESEMQHTS